MLPLEAGNYRLTVSYKTKGYRTVKEGKKTVEFTVMPAWHALSLSETVYIDLCSALLTLTIL